MKSARTKFALSLTCWLGLAGTVYYGNNAFFGEALDYLAPIILVLGAVHLGLLFREDLGMEGGDVLRRGLALLMVFTAVWLWSPVNPEVRMSWQPYSEELLESARREGRPVMIDFSASWCGPCRQMERKVFSKLEVVGEASRFLALKADMSNAHSTRAQALMQKYRVDGFPTVIFLGPDGVERSALRLIGYEGAQKFVGRLEAVK